MINIWDMFDFCFTMTICDFVGNKIMIIFVFRSKFLSYKRYCINDVIFL